MLVLQLHLKNNTSSSSSRSHLVVGSLRQTQFSSSQFCHAIHLSLFRWLSCLMVDTVHPSLIRSSLHSSPGWYHLFRSSCPVACTINIGGSVAQLQPTVCDIGVVLDTRLDMASQVSSVCRSAYYHLFRIAKIHASLTVVACKTLVHALVISRKRPAIRHH